MVLILEDVITFGPVDDVVLPPVSVKKDIYPKEVQPSHD